MQSRKPNTGPRPPQSAPGNKPQHSWHPGRRWPYYRHWYWHDYNWYDYDYDWYDYDYDYDYYDWDENYLAPNKSKGAPIPKRPPLRATEYTDDYTAYQEGFKAGWKAAMEYMIYGNEQTEPVEPMPPMPPMPPKPADITE